MSALFATLALALWTAPTATEGQWTLADHLDRVLLYEGRGFVEVPAGNRDLRSPGGGILLRAVTEKNGTLKPFSAGIAVAGQMKAGQLLFAGPGQLNPLVAEFVVAGGRQLQLDYGLSDAAQAKGNGGTRLEIELHAGSAVRRETVMIVENQWKTRGLELPAAGLVLVRLAATRRGGGSVNWTCMVLRGDGRMESRDDARRLSPNKDRIGKTVLTIPPSPDRVEARPGYDILFYRGKPWLSFSFKGFPRGSHAQQAALGMNTYYNEGLTFAPHWQKGRPGLEVTPQSALADEIRLCQELGVPFKTSMSLAHCSPFLPAWLVQQENLGLEGHKLRRGGDEHTSFIKSGTMQWYKRGLEGWMQAFRQQPAVFVFGQEDDASLWDDYSAEAVAGWRNWLARRFDNDFPAFARYVGGIKDATGFSTVPQPKRFEPDSAFGYPMRLAYLKLLWITDAYSTFMEEIFRFSRTKCPGIPVTQRYVNWPNGVYASRRVQADYNYTFGHLTVEGIPNGYGVGRKPHTGIYAHMATLPLPRGGSIGKAYSPKIRRGEMDAKEWRTNAFTALANGCCGFEYSTFTPAWGPEWERAAMVDHDFQLTATGRAGKPVIAEVLALSKYMLHYEQFPDVAVFHDASFNTGAFAGRWSQSKVGLYALIRECGFHPDVLTEWDMTTANLKKKKLLLLGGSLSIAPDIQAAIREYVRDGGMVLALFCAEAQGFPGANSYAYSCKPRASAGVQSFDDPPATDHLGDVLGIRCGGGLAERSRINRTQRDPIELAIFNRLVAEKRWVDRAACAASLKPLGDAKVRATFDDGSPAAIEHRYGQGRVITIGVDFGLVANNLTVPGICQWFSDLLAAGRCRKAVDSGNWFVEAGAWHDDGGHRLILLVNHDLEHTQRAHLPDGTGVDLGPGEALARVVGSR